MKRPRPRFPLPGPVVRALRRLGADLRDARRRRRLPMSVVADRALISRVTLHKIERGNPGVSCGHYATVLFVLGRLDGLEALATTETDRVGLGLEEERLPLRVRRSRPRPAAS